MDILSLSETVQGRIAYFGLSANPPTGLSGHLGIVRSLVQSGFFSEIWVAPVYIHMYSSKRNLASFEDRCNMCMLSMEFESVPTCRVRIVDIERTVFHSFNPENCKSYTRIGTVDVLQYILTRLPNITIGLVVGSDAFEDITAGKWKSSEKLFELANIYVFQRASDLSFTTHSVYPCIPLKWNIPEIDDHSISSTIVRNLKGYPLWPLCVQNNALVTALHPKVYSYIKNNCLYMFSSTEQNRVIRHNIVALANILLACTLCYCH